MEQQGYIFAKPRGEKWAVVDVMCDIEAGVGGFLFPMKPTREAHMKETCKRAIETGMVVVSEKSVEGELVTVFGQYWHRDNILNDFWATLEMLNEIASKRHD